MIHGLLFFMAGVCVGFAWGWTTARRFPDDPSNWA